MLVSDKFLFKNHVALMKIARDIMVTDIGSRLPAITDFSNRFNISRGTIQMALNFLSEEKAITLVKRGQQGSTLLSKDSEILWQYTGWGVLFGGMPLPLHGLVAGLATGVCECMKSNSINYNCVFLQGSLTRIKALLNKKIDFIVASKLTAMTIFEQYQGIEQVIEMPNVDYSGRYVLLFSPNNKELKREMVIAVDPTSIDQNYITNILCNEFNLNKKEMTYINTYKSTQKGETDLTVARLDVVENEYNNMYYSDIPEQYFDYKIEELNKTIIFAEKENYGLKQLLQKVINPINVERVQEKVINKLIPPQYY